MGNLEIEEVFRLRDPSPRLDCLGIHRYHVKVSRAEMTVTGLTIDPVSNSPIVVLREKDGERIVPIWIGAVEASSIAFELEGIKLARPMTHDLLKSAVESLSATVEYVAINALRESTYFATIELKKSGKTIELDARPSDAIALALRAKVPILCEVEVIESAQNHRDKPSTGIRTKKSLIATGEDAQAGPKPILDIGGKTPAELLESLEPEDFGKYKM